MLITNKVKGVLLIILGLSWVSFIYNFDILACRERSFGAKAVICFIAGLVILINGIRIYRRR